MAAPLASLAAYVLLLLGVPVWSLRRDPWLEKTIDLMAGPPMAANNVLLAATCGLVAWPFLWRRDVSAGRAAVVTLAVVALAALGGLASKLLGLHAIGATGYVLLYQAITAALVGGVLGVGLALARRRTS
ncbi:MAG TPA: hypothetical protein RMH99_09905 [Sandaracinaceae bacterium LLY-WYZ-13_1]|nr:hypothetical protein [Sandaracinaceae bacterium LLY-WYZ-13_1]